MFLLLHKSFVCSKRFSFHVLLQYNEACVVRDGQPRFLYHMQVGKYLEHGSPIILWQRATLVIVGLSAGHSWKNKGSGTC